MPAILNNPVSLSRYVPDSLRERAGVVALVVLMHAGLVWIGLARPEQAVPSEMSVSVTMLQSARETPPPLPQKLSLQKPMQKLPQKPLHRITMAEKAVTQTPAQEDAAEVVPLAETAPAVALPVAAQEPDTEPDYTANYLHNPRPLYPVVARRMGWQGRVVLNVEVLAGGGCGEVNVFRSSGHEILDKAALNTARSWRFVPAHHAGHAVTQWFRVPVNFLLEDKDA